MINPLPNQRPNDCKNISTRISFSLNKSCQRRQTLNVTCSISHFLLQEILKVTVNRIYVDVNDTFLHSETKDVHVFFKLCPVLLD